MVNLNRNNSNWSFEERRKINENWDILEGLANSTASGNNGLKSEVDQLKITVGQNTNRVTNSIQLSNQANIKSDMALTSANTALFNSNEAKTLAEGIDDKVNQANIKSDSALTSANTALFNSNEAIEKSEYVQSQLDSVVADGDSSAEVVQARKGKTNLRERLDDEYNEVTSQLEQISWVREAFSGVRFIAHRGFSGLYPENTTKSYFEASAAGFFGWECDPWITIDGHWVNVHDSTVDRTTNGTGDVANMTLAQLRALKIDGGNNVAIFKGLQIPTMEEIFNLASQQTHQPFIFLNNRTTTPIDAPRTKTLADLIKKYNYERRCFMFINDTNSFDGIRKEVPTIGICWDFGNFLPSDAQLDKLATYAPNAFASINHDLILTNVDIIEKCKSRDILIQAHTVDSAYKTGQLIKLGVSSILTNTIIN